MAAICLHTNHFVLLSQESQLNQPSQAVLNEVRSIVHEASKAIVENDPIAGRMGECGSV